MKRLPLCIATMVCVVCFMLLLGLAACSADGFGGASEASGSTVGMVEDPAAEEQQASEPTEALDTVLVIMVNGNRLEAILEDNGSARALAEALESGPISYRANDYGGFEKVGDIGMMLPTDDARITAVPGDVILYQGDKVCIYYGTNTWSFTRLGHIDVDNGSELEELLGAGEVEVTLSLG